MFELGGSWGCLLMCVFMWLPTFPNHVHVGRHELGMRHLVVLQPIFRLCHIKKFSRNRLPDVFSGRWSQIHPDPSQIVVIPAGSSSGSRSPGGARVTMAWVTMGLGVPDVQCDFIPYIHVSSPTSTMVSEVFLLTKDYKSNFRQMQQQWWEE